MFGWAHLSDARRRHYDRSVRTVLVLGAGASLAQAISYRPVQLKDHPPLDSTFFQTALALSAESRRIRLRVRALYNALPNAPQLSDPFARPVAPLEQFFADVYYEVASRRRPEAYNVFVHLVRLYSSVIAHTTNWMAIRTDGGVLDRFLQTEIEAAGSDTPTVITFNHDLVIENCIYRLTRRSPDWCLTALYADANFSQLRTAVGNPAFNHHNVECAHEPPVLVLKLHGSLNWSLKASRPAPPISETFPNTTSLRVYLQQRQEAGAGIWLHSPANRNKRRRYLWPLIVPPIYDKQRIVGMDLLQMMWDRAGDAVASAERIVLIGYSMPESDILARQLMRRSYAANPARPPIDVVNPDGRVATKIQNLLDCRVVRSYRDLPSFVQ